jgi:phospholipase/carboxylesterase
VVPHQPHRSGADGAGVRGAAAHLHGFIDQELERYALPASACAWSASAKAPCCPCTWGCSGQTPRAVVGYSGMLADPAPPASRPPILLVHGDRDEVIPIGALLASTHGLARLGVPSLWRISGGAGHTIAEDGLSLGAVFLRDAFRGRFRGWAPPVSRPASCARSLAS